MQSETKALLMIGALAFGFGIWFFYRLQRWWGRRCLRRRFDKGIKAEARAAGILRRHGYRVTAVQKPLSMTMVIDGKAVSYMVRPDALAMKNRRLYIVEVKTGEYATNPLFSETRRQLLEYYHGLPAVDGVLLVNADSEGLHHVQFSGRREPIYQWPRLALAFLTGGVFVLLWKTL